MTVIQVPPPQPFPPCYVCNGDPGMSIGFPNKVIPLDIIPSEFAAQIPQLIEIILYTIPPEFAEQIPDLADQIPSLAAGFEVTCGLLDSFARGAALLGFGLTTEQCQLVNLWGDEILEM